MDSNNVNHRIEEVFKKYYQSLIRKFLAFNCTQEEAEDYAMDIIYNFVECNPPVIHNEGGYINQMAYNYGVDKWRKKKKIAFKADDELNEEDKANFNKQTWDEESNPSIIVERKEVYEALEEELPFLSPSHRDLVYYVHFKGMELNKYAKMRGIKEGTAKSRNYRAKAILRKRLENKKTFPKNP